MCRATLSIRTARQELDIGKSNREEREKFVKIYIYPSLSHNYIC